MKRIYIILKTNYMHEENVVTVCKKGFLSEVEAKQEAESLERVEQRNVGYSVHSVTLE